jgi:hypothetical protein
MVSFISGYEGTPHNLSGSIDAIGPAVASTQGANVFDACAIGTGNESVRISARRSGPANYLPGIVDAASKRIYPAQGADIDYRFAVGVNDEGTEAGKSRRREAEADAQGCGQDQVSDFTVVDSSHGLFTPVNVAAWKKHGLIAFQDRPCSENFKVKKSADGFLFTASISESTATIMLLPEPKVLQETHLTVLLAVLHVAKCLYRDARPVLSSARIVIYEPIYELRLSA